MLRQLSRTIPVTGSKSLLILKPRINLNCQFRSLATTTSTIPKVQRALVTDKTGKDYQIHVDYSYPVPQLKEKEVLVKLTHSGICHSDLSLIQDHWNGGVSMQCKVAGHEGVGRIVAHGSKVDPSKFPEGLRVGVPMTKEICNHCESCLTPDGEVYCDNVTGFAIHEDGTFQEYVPVNTEYLVTVPENLPGKLAAPLLCGGVTAYKGIKKANLNTGEFLAVFGAGGGLGSMAIQYAKVAGLRIIAIDIGEHKKESCLNAGAEYFIDSSKVDNLGAEVYKYTKRGVHGAVVFPPSKQAYDQALSTLGKHGTLVCVGLPGFDESINFKPSVSVFLDQKAIGSMMGGRKDLIECLNIASKFGINFPVQEVSIEEAPEALDKMSKGKLVGRASIKY